MGFNDGYRRSLQGLIDDMGDTGVVLRKKVHLLYLRGHTVSCPSVNLDLRLLISHSMLF